MKYPTLLMIAIMFILGIAMLFLIPLIFSNLEEGYQALIAIVAILVCWGWMGLWYNRKG